MWMRSGRGTRTMGCEVGDTANCVALNFDIGREHLPDEGLESAQGNNEQLVLGYTYTA